VFADYAHGDLAVSRCRCYKHTVYDTLFALRRRYHCGTGHVPTPPAIAAYAVCAARLRAAAWGLPRDAHAASLSSDLMMSEGDMVGV